MVDGERSAMGGSAARINVVANISPRTDPASFIAIYVGTRRVSGGVTLLLVQ